MDGDLGNFLSRKTEEQINYRVLGYFENGFRHISNKLRPIHKPDDLKKMRIRVLPSDVQARTFKLLGAQPHRLDLTEAIEGIQDGILDAQENPFANTVTYDIHKFHPYHTKSHHFYISRGIFANRTAFYSWPDNIKKMIKETVTNAIIFQRNLAENEAIESQKIIEAEMPNNAQIATIMGRYYAVKRGIQTGIFRSWKDCEQRIKGYTGALFKRFSTREEAQAYLDDREPDRDLVAQSIKEESAKLKIYHLFMNMNCKI